MCPSRSTTMPMGTIQSFPRDHLLPWFLTSPVPTLELDGIYCMPCAWRSTTMIIPVWLPASSKQGITCFFGFLHRRYPHWNLMAFIVCLVRGVQPAPSKGPLAALIFVIIASGTDRDKDTYPWHLCKLGCVGANGPLHEREQQLKDS